MDAAAAVDDGGEIETETETVGFECNICFGLAEDPVITRCGHLHCWPCLYEWLRFHSQCHECPVCKAVIQDEELIPLNGRGESTFRRRLVPRRRRSGRSAAAEVPAVVRVRFREFSSGLNGYGAWGGGGGGGGEEEEGYANGDNMKKIMFFILLFVVFDFLII